MTPQKNCSIDGKNKTREDVLNFVYSDFISEKLKKADFETAQNVKISIGFPKGKAIGQCFSEKAGESFYHIFITPQIKDFVRIVDILLHQAIHTRIGGHRRNFAKVAAAAGLVQPWTATTASPLLRNEIENYIKEKAIIWQQPAIIETSTKKKQTTRMMKLECPQCEYIIRTAAKNIEEKGLPVCPCGEIFKTPEDD